jgi:hypothetical protein
MYMEFFMQVGGKMHRAFPIAATKPEESIASCNQKPKRRQSIAGAGKGEARIHAIFLVPFFPLQAPILTRGEDTRTS